jgi:PDZ domain-containing protein
VFYFVLTLPLPYYIHTTGGLIDISEKVSIEGGYKKKGSFNLSYVTEMRGNVLTYLLSYVIPSWDLVSKNEYVPNNETYDDVDYRNKILLEEANANATIVAYQAANKEINIKSEHFYVVYVDELAKTTLKVGDELIGIQGTDVKSIDDYINIVSKNNVGDKLNITVIDKNKKEENRVAEVFLHDNVKVTGILISTKYDYQTNPKITFNFKESESGPSGGLMMSLAIYNELTTENLTKGLTIVGTGTIDVNGNVGEISGIEYKLKGAVKAGADIFLAPSIKNYDEAIKIAKENDYDIKIIGVSTFYDALNYLRGV